MVINDRIDTRKEEGYWVLRNVLSDDYVAFRKEDPRDRYYTHNLLLAKRFKSFDEAYDESYVNELPDYIGERDIYG